jgi:hypothetical protein
MTTILKIWYENYAILQSIYIKMDVCVCVCVYVCMFEHNSGTPGVISTKLGTYIAICMFYIYEYSAGRMVWEAGNLDDSHC